MPVCLNCGNWEYFLTATTEYNSETYNRHGEVIDADWVESRHVETSCEECGSTNVSFRMSVEEWEKATDSDLEDY